MSTDPRASCRAYRFGAFEADLPSGDLKRQGLRVKLRGRPFDILVILLERGGEVVTRDELRERLWAADTFVDFDHGLNAAMNKLREALGDAADNPRFIETIPRKGYRFIAPFSPVVEGEVQVPAVASAAVSALSDAPEASVAPSVPSTLAPRPRRRTVWVVVLVGAVVIAAVVFAASARWRRSGISSAPRQTPLRLAVLPFRNISNDTDQEYFVDGMTDALIAELAQISGLRVISRTSVMPYKSTQKTLPQIARELDVDAVVEGSAVKSGDRVRITAQLIEASSDRHLWARNYECEMGDVLDVQRRVAREVTDEVRVAVTPPEKERLERPATVSPPAYEAYLRGRFLRDKMTSDSLHRSLEYFQKAIEQDPDYAAAYAGLADAYWIIGVPGYELLPQSDTAPKARAAARKALELDDSLASARAILAMVSIYYDWDWPEAEASLKSILDQNPSLARVHIWYSGYLAAMGRPEEAIKAAQRGLELDPLSPTAGQTLGMRYFYGRQYDRATAEFRKTLELDPRSFVARMGLGESEWIQGKRHEAIADVEQAEIDSGGSAWVLSWLGYAYGASGDQAKARGVLARLDAMSQKGYVPRFYPALVYAGMGDADAAVDWLEKAYAERSGWMLFLNVQPEFDQLLGNRRFRDLLARVGHKAPTAPPMERH